MSWRQVRGPVAGMLLAALVVPAGCVAQGPAERDRPAGVEAPRPAGVRDPASPPAADDDQSCDPGRACGRPAATARPWRGSARGAG
ncbi:hypothetical protein [Phytohabitans rumicis]|uniref:hypothetical protein n=1 Tax=Phytohabitans rumicis TaxID=1076125 RepID=UPI001C498714|nr:hypothetical protein [Phytohabitans rumicis]